MDFTEKLRNAPNGSIVPCVRVLAREGNALQMFSKLSDYGRKEHSILLESADIVKKYGEQSLGTAEPCLRLSGKGSSFAVEALNNLGERFLENLNGEFDFCNSVEYGKRAIKGTLKPVRKAVSEQERLKLKTHADIMRAVAFRLKPTGKPFSPYAGLFGAISYDFIDQFEDLPKNRADVLNDPDYELYFVDNLFLMNHPERKIYFVANALLFGDADAKAEAERCEKIVENYERKLFSSDAPKARKFRVKKAGLASDTGRKEFIGMVKSIRRHILAGDVFQAVVSRTLVRNYSAEPLGIYRQLREINPSPYMFYMNSPSGILLGASPETFISVKGEREKRVEIKPIAGTKPRGIVNGKIDPELDSRYEAELKLDRKELAEHTMLIDLARNDVARVCVAGSRIVENPYEVEKYSHVQHLVSKVSGNLKPGLDCLHAYLASMNMGTLTGAPKVEAMKLIRKYEKAKRGFYGGAVAYITPSGELDSAITIRSARLKKGKAHVRAGAGIVYDSVPENEFEETGRKAGACIKAIELAEADAKKGAK